MQIRKIHPVLFLLTFASISTNATDLYDVYTLAQKNDAQFRAETSAYYAAKQQTPAARSALLPQINGVVSSTEGTNDVKESSFCDIGVSECNVKQDSEEFSWTVSLRQSLYNHANWKRLQQANALAAQAEAEYEAAKQSLILRVAETYFNILAAQDNLTFAEAETKAVGQQLEQARQRFEVGLIAITDVKESQAEYDNAVASEIQARNLLDNYEEALWTLTNTDIPNLAKLGDKLALQPPEPTDKQQWVDNALEANLDLLAAQYGREAAHKEVGIQRSGHYPSLDLVARQQYSDSQGGSFGAMKQTNTSVGVELSVPIFSGGGVHAKVKSAVYNRDAADERLEYTRRLVIQQTRNAYQDTLANISRVKALEQALISSQAAYEATEAGFEVGTRNSVEVLLSLRNTFRAERDYARTRYDYLINTLKLKQATGNLQVTDLRVINSWLDK